MAGCFHHIHLHKIKSYHRKRKSLCLEERKNSLESDNSNMTLTNNKLPSKLGRLFRSKSEQGLKSSPCSSPKSSPRSSGAPPRRRLLRVVRDDQSEGEEWENPHVVRRYSKQYWEKQMEEARTLQHSESLPYDVNTEHTILKKTRQSSCGSTTATDSESEVLNGRDSPSIGNKRACFKDEVQVIEFIGKEKITKRIHYMHEARLVDSEEEETLQTVYEDNSMDLKQVLKRERVNEFSKAKELSESVEESDEEDEPSVFTEGSSAVSSDDQFSSAGCSSDSEEPKKKQKKKKKSSLKVRFLALASRGFSDSSSAPSDSLDSVEPVVQKCLLRLHEQSEVDVEESDDNVVGVVVET